jgi:hypothetical protein
MSAEEYLRTALRAKLSVYACSETLMKKREGVHLIPDIAVFRPSVPALVPGFRHCWLQSKCCHRLTGGPQSAKNPGSIVPGCASRLGL